MTDRLTLTRALEDAGIQSALADRIATEIYDAIHDNVATKADLERLEAGLRIDLERVDAGLRAELRALEQRLELRFEKVQRQIDRMVTRLGAAIVVIAGLLFGALRYWPPPG